MFSKDLSNKDLTSEKDKNFLTHQIKVCPGLNANKIQIPYDMHHKVFSLVERHLNTHNSVKYEVV